MLEKLKFLVQKYSISTLMDKRLRKCFLTNVIIFKFYFVFVIYIVSLLEMIFQLDFLCSWRIMKSFYQLIRTGLNRIFIFRNFGKILVTTNGISRFILLKKKGTCNVCLKAGQYVQHILQTQIPSSVYMNKSQGKMIYLCNFAKHVFNVYRRRISVRNIKFLSQQWRHENNLPNMFKVNIKKLG